MINEFSRLELLTGEDALNKIKATRVAIFGVGGVGGYVLEALIRSGFSSFALIDNDVVSLTNLNRQIIATHLTIGKKKTGVAKERALLINPNAKIETYEEFYLPNNKDFISFKDFNYVVDAIDTVAGKLTIIEEAKKNNVKVISSMGCGNRFDPSKLKISDISKTSMDPLAKVMRHELKKRGIYKCNVLFSLEKPIKPVKCSEEVSSKRSVPGSTSFVPSSAGLLIASWIFKDVTGIKEPTN